MYLHFIVISGLHRKSAYNSTSTAERSILRLLFPRP